LAVELAAGGDKPGAGDRSDVLPGRPGATLKNLDDRREWLLARQAGEAVKAKANPPTK